MVRAIIWFETAFGGFIECDETSATVCSDFHSQTSKILPIWHKKRHKLVKSAKTTRPESRDTWPAEELASARPCATISAG